MRIFTLNGSSVTETDSLTHLQLPEQGYLWIACARDRKSVV